MNTTEYDKLRTVMRHWLKGLAASDHRYFVVLNALDFFEHLHRNEIRKDGVTRGFSHQLNMLAFARTQHKNIEEPWRVYAAILGHDGPEDYPVEVHNIKARFPSLFDYFMRLSKWRDGELVSYDVYFPELAECRVCSVAKAIDRINNYSTMLGVFKPEKVEQYIDDGHTWFLPMLKKARRTFPQQEPIYELLKSVLVIQMDASKHFLSALNTESTGQPVLTILKGRDSEGRAEYQAEKDFTYDSCNKTFLQFLLPGEHRDK